MPETKRRKIKVLGKSIPLVTVIISFLLLSAGVGIGAVIFRLQVDGSVTLAPNTYGVTLWDSATDGTEVTEITFNGGLVANKPSQQVSDVTVWLAPDDDPTVNAIDCYMLVENVPSGMTLEVGWYHPVTQVYNAITTDGATQFYQFPSGHSASGDFRLKLRFRLTVDANQPEGSHTINISIDGADA